MRKNALCRHVHVRAPVESERSKLVLIYTDPGIVYLKYLLVEKKKGTIFRTGQWFHFSLSSMTPRRANCKAIKACKQIL